jgi:hypothetical protein
VIIIEPKSLITIGHSPLTVRGTVNRPEAILVVNGNRVDHANGKFEALVTVEEGYNVITAGVTEGAGAQVTDTISVSLDLTPPYVTVESHSDGQKVYTDSITVTGLVNDIVRGTIESEQAEVRVNGVVATVSNRSYAANNVALVEGNNQIKITAADQVGNTETKIISLNYQKPVGKRIVRVSGDAQIALINNILPEPFVVKLEDGSGNPVPNETVVFRVTQDSGEVAAGTENEGRAVISTTNAQGQASTFLRLGLRTGVANNKVKAAAVGYDGDVIFTASATTQIGNKLSVNSGNNQRGVVGQILPAPLVAVVTDQGANVVKGARVKFETELGNGIFENNQSNMEVLTDSDGRATVRFKLGDLQGLDAQKIRATLLDAPSGQNVFAGFMATGFIPGDPGLTMVTGVVLDNQDNPIPGITMHIEGTTRKAQTNEQGRFVITSAPVGPIHLVADGSSASVAGEFPNLSYRMVTIAGVDNPLPSPIYMVKLNTKEAVFAGRDAVELTLEKFPGFKLEIAKNSVTFPDGAREGYVSVTAVNASAVPMAPPNGMQPQFIVTIQPTGTRFDEPARLSLPNVDGHPPGAQVEMYSYDHDLEEFVSIGLGTVSEDGSFIRSNPGVGVVKAGWHCSSQPGGSGTAYECGECDKCDGVKCVNDPSKANKATKNQKDGDCNTKNCDGETPTPADEPTVDKIDGDCRRPGCNGGEIDEKKNVDDEDIKDEDKPCKKCDAGELVADKEKEESEFKCGDGSPSESCYTCKDGNCGNNCTVDDKKDTFSIGGDVDAEFVPGLGKVISVARNLVRKLPKALSCEFGAVRVTGTYEKGEQCCTDCERGTKGMYELVGGSGSLTVDCTVGADFRINRKFPAVLFEYGVEVEVDADAKGGLFPTVGVEVGANGQWNATCQDGCIQGRAGMSLGLAGGFEFALKKAEMEFKVGKTRDDLDFVEIKGMLVSATVDLGEMSGSAGTGYGDTCDKLVECSVSYGASAVNVTFSGGTVEFLDAEWATITLPESMDFEWTHELWPANEVANCE